LHVSRHLPPTAGSDPSPAEPAGSAGPAGGGAAGDAFAGRTLIILNPNAGNENPASVCRRIGGAYAARGASFDLVMTERPGHATELAREAVRLGYGAVAACGGDGTLAEAASALAGSMTPLAVLPRGTANQVAMNLGIPLDLEHAVEVAVGGHTTTIDLGLIGDRAFTLVAGAGFDAAVMEAATRELKERWGFAAYIYAAVKQVLSAEPRRFRITADDRELEVDAVSVMVANVGELFSRWLPLRVPLGPRPTSAWHDGLLDVVVLAPRNPQDVAALLWRAAQGGFSTSDRLLHFQTHTITIAADPPIAVQVDGDPAGVTPVSMSVMRDAMRIIVPG
jgi:diacylglycerol kinase (ATP)